MRATAPRVGSGKASFPLYSGFKRSSRDLGALSGAMMLRHLREPSAAERVEHAVDAVLGEGAIRTPDLGGTSSTQEVGRAIVEAMPS